MAGNENETPDLEGIPDGKQAQPESVGEILGRMPEKKPRNKTTKVPAVKGSAGQGAKMGRPTGYSNDLAAEICAQLAMGASLRTVCKDPNMPAASSVFKWLSENEDFSEQYARAKQESADAMAEDILYIADTQEIGEITVEKEDLEGNIRREVRTEDMIQHRRLKIDTRKFLMAKMKPKKYGDKLDLTTAGDKLNRGMSDAELDAILSRAAGPAPDKASPDTEAR